MSWREPTAPGQGLLAATDSGAWAMARAGVSEEDQLFESMAMAFCETFTLAGLWKPWVSRRRPLREGFALGGFKERSVRMVALLLMFCGMAQAITAAAGLYGLLAWAAAEQNLFAFSAAAVASLMALVMAVRWQLQTEP